MIGLEHGDEVMGDLHTFQAREEKLPRKRVKSLSYVHFDGDSLLPCIFVITMH